MKNTHTVTQFRRGKTDVQNNTILPEWIRLFDRIFSVHLFITMWITGTKSSIDSLCQHCGMYDVRTHFRTYNVIKIELVKSATKKKIFTSTENRWDDQTNGSFYNFILFVRFIGNNYSVTDANKQQYVYVNLKWNASQITSDHSSKFHFCIWIYRKNKYHTIHNINISQIGSVILFPFFNICIKFNLIFLCSLIEHSFDL